MGRVKFAVKEIRYKDSMEVQKNDEMFEMEEEFEEYEEVESIMKVEDEGVNEDELKRCRFCW